MTAVVCELVGVDEADARTMLTARLPDMARALVEGLRRAQRTPRQQLAEMEALDPASPAALSGCAAPSCSVVTCRSIRALPS